MTTFNPEDHLPAVVIDNGSGYCKAGFACDDAPRAVFPAITRKRCRDFDPSVVGMERKDCYVGDEARPGPHDTPSVLSFAAGVPSTHGGVVAEDWEHTEKIWHHTFYNELRVSPEDRPVLLAEAPLKPKASREKMAQIMIESFKVPAFYLVVQQVMALYASGRTTGLVVDCGDRATYATPVYDGSVLSNGVKKTKVAGRDVTKYLWKILIERGCSLLATHLNEVDVADIKEKLGYTAVDYQSEIDAATKSASSAIEKSYELPDGRVVTVGNERFRSTEVLFKPSLAGKDCAGIHETVYSSMMSCDCDTDIGVSKEMFYKDTVLAGGSTLFAGFADRLSKELSALVGPSSKVKVIAPAERKYSVWIGGAVMASLPSFQQAWISKDEYEEIGPSVVHRKCDCYVGRGGDGQ